LEAKSIVLETAKSISIDSKCSKEVSEFQLYNIAMSITRKVISHQHNLTTQSLNTHVWIGEDRDVSCKPKANTSMPIGDQPLGALRNETHVSGDN
jgi:hypothetical protein